jgi:two-component system sensor histidine kinase UhpB
MLPLSMMSGTSSSPEPALDFDDVPFRGIVEQSLAGIYVVLDERFMYANDTFAAMFGYARDEFIGRRMVDCVTPDSVQEVMQNYRRRISGEVQAIHYFTKGLRRDGQIVHLELHASRVACRGRPALTGVALDITERVLAQEALRRSREQLRELAQHISTAREVERARLAREVHDVLGGMLSSAKFDLSRIVRRTTAAGQEDLHRIATELVDLVQETIDTARSISDEMRPVSLDLLGLGAALRQALERFSIRHRAEVVIQAAEAPLQIAPDAATQVFRIVQEALTNVARHAQATRVVLQIEQRDGMLELRLRDNGLGIDRTQRRRASIGLFSMAERAREIGATLEVGPGRDGGTEMTLRLPLPVPTGDLGS